MVKYELRKRVLSGSYSVSLTEAEYIEILQARNILLTALNIEEAFDILVDNYFDFEITLLQSAFSQMIRLPTTAVFQSERRLFNRRLINLLSTGTAYLDSTCHSLSTIFGKESTEFDNIQTKRSEVHDKNRGYRVMEALRNHTQHFGWSIHGFTYHSELIGEDIAEAKIRSTITIHSIMSHLEENPKFNKKILAELRRTGEDIGVEQLVREYLEGLADIHNEVRNLSQLRVRHSDEVILTAINRFESESGGESFGLELTSENNDNTLSAVAIFKQLTTSRQDLERKNQNLVNLPKRFVTSEIIEKRKNK